jgi:rod shape-determining protein MreD
MRPAMIFFWLLLGFVFQSALFPAPLFYGIDPNLDMILIVFVAMLRGKHLGLLLGFLIGLIQDIQFGSYLGLHAFAMGIVGFFSASTIRYFLHRHLALVMINVLGYTVAYEGILYGINRVFGMSSLDTWVVLLKVVHTMVWNGAFTLLLYPWLNRFLAAGRTFPLEE